MRAAALVLFAGAAWAQTAEYSEWMKTADAATRPETGEAIARAERLGAVYEKMIGYWRQRRAPDAVKWSEQGKAAAVQMAAAAYAGDAEKAETAFQAVRSTCQPCHDAYRVKLANGKYRIRGEIDEPEKKP